jgi:hypothetical protein
MIATEHPIAGRRRRVRGIDAPGGELNSRQPRLARKAAMHIPNGARILDASHIDADATDSIARHPAAIRENIVVKWRQGTYTWPTMKNAA